MGIGISGLCLKENEKIFFKHQNIIKVLKRGGGMKWIKFPALVRNTFLAYKNTWAKMLRHVPNTALFIKSCYINT